MEVKLKTRMLVASGSGETETRFLVLRRKLSSQAALDGFLEDLASKGWQACEPKEKRQPQGLPLAQKACACCGHIKPKAEFAIRQWARESPQCKCCTAQVQLDEQQAASTRKLRIVKGFSPPRPRTKLYLHLPRVVSSQLMTSPSSCSPAPSKKPSLAEVLARPFSDPSVCPRCSRYIMRCKCDGLTANSDHKEICASLDRRQGEMAAIRAMQKETQEVIWDDMERRLREKGIVPLAERSAEDVGMELYERYKHLV